MVKNGDKTAIQTKKTEKKTEKMNQTPAQPEIHDLIGQRLRSFYDEVSKQPVPDRFVELLNQLEAKSSPKKSS
jgi:anti-sigma factor NepR-like protein